MSNWIEKAAKEIEERVDSCETISTKAAADIIITAYEQSQKEFETANKRIAELEKLLKRVEPMAASGLYREITEVLYVVKGA